MITGAKQQERRRVYVLAAVGFATFLCAVLWWSRPPPTAAVTCAPKASDGAGVRVASTDASRMSDSDKAKCYGWLEGDLQECEYVIKWLQLNSADEDARTGHTPTATQLAEREAVARKTLYCKIAAADQSLWQDAERFRSTFYAHIPANVLKLQQNAAAVAAATKAVTAPGAACPKCPACAACPEHAPAPVVAAPVVAAAPKREKRVISFGLYGADPKYVNGAMRNAELCPSVFPGWVMRVYHDDSVPSDKLQALKERGVELVRMARESGSIAGMFWRFLVADDPTVDRYIVRDTDSRLHEREARAVDAWIASGKKYHILRDHPSHSMATVSGGIWGGVHDPNLHISEKMGHHTNKNDYIQDMYFLGDKIYPIMLKEGVIAHDSYSCSACATSNSGLCKNKFPESVAFPTPRVGYYHAGQVFDANDVPRQGDIDIIARSPPPPECTAKWPHASL